MQLTGQISERGLSRAVSGGAGRAAVTGRGFGLHGGHDLVVPGEDLRRIGRAEAEGFGHDGGRQRPGDGTPELSLTVRLDGQDQVAGLGLDEGGEPGLDLAGAERTGERPPVVAVPCAVDRKHAGAYHLGGGEPGVIDREPPGVPQHLDRFVVPGHQPAAEGRHPADGCGGSQPGEHRVRIGFQGGQRDRLRR